MTEDSIQRMQELCKLLQTYSSAYYQEDAPLVSDAEYDGLEAELLSLEKQTGVVLPDSPSLHIGGTPLEKFEKHTHLAPLWSLDKVRTVEGIRDWMQRCRNSLGENAKALYVLEYKFDGLTINLTYENGVLIQGATRGNGTVGEAMLPQIRTIRSLPQTIPFKGRMEVQGECIMRLSVLSNYNKTAQEPLKNARNAAAGALRNLDPSVTAQRKLDCFCYNIGYIEGKDLKNQIEMRSFLKDNGFPISPYAHYGQNADELLSAIKQAGAERDSLDFLIDGMVIKLVDFSQRQELGFTEKFPRWAMAYKFAAEEVTATVESISWELGRTGKLTPVAHLTPVELAGVTVSNATLNNWDDIQRKRVGIGSRVFIRRSNDVIPEILGAVPDDTPTSLAELPRFCPYCHAHVEQRGAHIYCTNPLSCKPQIVSRLAHFAGREAMDIESFADKTASFILDTLNISTIPALYQLTKEQLLDRKGFGDKKIDKLLAAIEQSKTRPLSAFLFALGIPNVGIRTAKDLSRHFGTLDAIRNATAEELLSIPDIGETVTNSIVQFFHDESISQQLNKLISLGLSPTDDGNIIEESPIKGMSIVVTGTLPTLSRKEAEDMISSYGGKPVGSVSKKTDFVLAGEAAGSKLTKAQSMGIRIIDEETFLQLLKEGSDANRKAE